VLKAADRATWGGQLRNYAAFAAAVGDRQYWCVGGARASSWWQLRNYAALAVVGGSVGGGIREEKEGA